MKRILTTSVAALAAIIVCCTAGDNPAFGQGGSGSVGPPSGVSYQILELDSGDGVFTTTPQDINSSGEIVGRAHSAELALSAPAYWTVEGSGETASSTLHLMDCGSEAGVAFGINDAGIIVGRCGNRAAYWPHPDAAPMLLPVPEGTAFSVAVKINEDGVICGRGRAVGEAVDEFPTPAVCLVWRVNLEFVDGEPTPEVWGPLVLPAPGTSSVDFTINLNDNDESGSAIVIDQWRGETGPVTAAWNVVSLDDGSLTADGPLVIDALLADAINNSDVLCGRFPNPDGPWLAAVLDGGSLQILDSSTRFKWNMPKQFGGVLQMVATRATDINADGAIVGQAWWGGFRMAVVWPSADSRLVVLNDFIDPHSFRLEQATAISDPGLVVGYGWTGGVQTGFVAIPQ